MKKEMKKLIDAIKAQNWTVELGSRHYQCKAPDGVGLVTLSASPSDCRSLKNSKAQLRRAGAIIA